jgi:hypothetical protein
MKSNSTLIFLGLLAFISPVSSGHAASEQTSSYGARVKYEVGKKIEFPDFTIEYVGERRKSGPVYPRPFLYCDFKITQGATEKMVSWTAGTGDIGPMDFEVGGKHYQLELRHSDKLGKLKDGELVIWQANLRS